MSGKQSARIEWLDGWRAIAIIMVIAAHIGNAYGFVSPVSGEFGVFIFFAISGYIVTSLLLKEWSATGGIDFANFFLRRFLRIGPPLAIYVVACMLLGQAGIFPVVRSLAFTCNMTLPLGDCGWTFGHTWSLGFEEQFYLLLPFAFLGLKTPKHFLAFAVVGSLAITPFILPIQFIGRTGFLQIYLLLVLSALLALNETKIVPQLKRIPAWLGFAMLALVGLWFNLPLGVLRSSTSLAIPPMIVASMYALPHASQRARVFLSSLPMSRLGLYSYTFYLWQQLSLTNASWNRGITPILLLGGALTIAVVSYHTLEAVCRNWARNLRASTNASKIRVGPNSTGSFCSRSERLGRNIEHSAS